MKYALLWSALPFAVLLLVSCTNTVDSASSQSRVGPGVESARSSGGMGWNLDSKTGLAVRLIAVGPFVVGKPVIVSVEAKNMGHQTICFDLQGASTGTFTLRQPDGNDAPYVDASGWTGQTSTKIVCLKPEESCEIVRADLADQFALLHQGQYICRFRGIEKWEYEGAEEAARSSSIQGMMVSVTPSLPLNITIGEGAASLRDILVQRLLPVLPKEWMLREGHKFTGYQPPGVEIICFKTGVDGADGTASFSVYCGQTFVDGKSKISPRALGKSPWGEIWMGDLTVRGSTKDSRKSSSASLENDLRKQLIPVMEARIAKVLQIR